MLKDELPTPSNAPEAERLTTLIEMINNNLERRLPNGWTITRDITGTSPGTPVVTCHHDYLPAGELLIVAPTGSITPACESSLRFTLVIRRFSTSRDDIIGPTETTIPAIASEAAALAMDRYHTDGPRWSPLTALARGADTDLVRP